METPSTPYPSSAHARPSVGPLDTATGLPLLEALAAALAAHRPIAFNVNLARVTGCVKAGLFASQLLYWTRVGTDVERRQGWIIKSRDQWMLETGLTRHEQETARKRLVDSGLLQECKVGMPPTTCFRIDARMLGVKLAALVKADPVQWTLFDLRSSAEQVRALLGRNLALYRLYTELCGSVPAAVLLAKGLALQRNVLAAQIDRLAKQRATHTPGAASAVPEAWEHSWFYLAASQWEVETGLTNAQLRVAKQKLCRSLLLEEAVQTHPTRKVFQRVNLHRLTAAVREQLEVTLRRGQRTGNPLLNALAVRLSHTVPAATATGTNGLRSSPDGAQILQSDSVTSVRINCALPNPAFEQRSGVSAPLGVQILQTDAAASVRRTCAPASATMSATAIPARFAETGRQEREIPPLVRPLSAVQAAGFSRSSSDFSHLRRPVLAVLHARARPLTTSFTTTTTTPPALAPSAASVRKCPVVVVPDERSTADSAACASGPAWPDGLLPDARNTCRRILDGLSPQRQQELLDELAGRMAQGRVKAPVAYLGHLVRRDRDAPGGLVLEIAHDVRAARVARQAHEQRLAAARLLPAAATSPTAEPVDVNAVREKLRQQRAEFAGKSGLPK